MNLNIFAAVGAVSLISLIGLATISISHVWLKKISLILVSLAAGTLLGDALLHLLPEALAESAPGALSVWMWVLGGIIAFFVLEKVIHWRHCHVPTAPNHPHPLGIMNLVGDGFHNFFDGILIAGAFLADPALGIATTVAVIFHEIPQEIADFGVLLHAGFSRGKALLMNFASALFAFAGAGLVILWPGAAAHSSDILVPFTAGGFLYIAVSDLIPELKKENNTLASLFQLCTILIGLGFMYLLKIVSE